MAQSADNTYHHSHHPIVSGYRWLVVIGLFMVLLIDPLVCHSSCQSFASSSEPSVHASAGEMSQFLCFWQASSTQVPDQPSDHNPLTHHSHAATVVIVLGLALATLRLACTLPIMARPPLASCELPLRPPILQTA